MSIDLTEQFHEGTPAAGRPRSVPYLKLVHSTDRLRNNDDQEDADRSAAFTLIIGATAVAVLGALAYWLA